MNLPNPYGKYVHAFAKAKIPYPFGPLDERGVPLYDPKLFRLKGPPIYHPTPILQYALAHYELMLDGKQTSVVPFRACCEWLLDHQETMEPGFTSWLIPLPLRFPKIDRPWISGLTQGQMLSLLLRYHHHSADPRAMTTLKQAAQAFLHPMEKGGIMTFEDDGAAFIQELAYPPLTYILNGCMYSWIGLDEYCSVVDDPPVHQVRDAVIKGLEKHLPKYDNGWNSLYSLGIRWNLADVYYHGVHVMQLEYLAKRLDHPLFAEYAEKWRKTRDTPPSMMNLMERHFKKTTLRAMTVLGLSRFKFVTV